MACPAYIREKARQLRRDKKLTIDELAERLAISRTTIYYWVGTFPSAVSPRRRGRRPRVPPRAKSNRRRFRELREAAYEDGLIFFPTLATQPSFRDFVCLYIAEGFKRNRNVVGIANSDPAVLHAARSLDA